MRTSETREELVLAVDGGNSKTVALVARRDGTIKGAGRDGCSDIYAAGSPEVALRAVESTVWRALEAARADARDLAAGVFSMAGADWPEDIELLRTAMAQRGFGRTVTVVNDAMGALRAGSPDGTGVVVVCGTGAAIGARSSDGRTWHSSWWQETQGSTHLAQKTLRAIYRAELGIDPPTTLTARVPPLFGQQSVEGVLHLFTSRLTQRPRDLGGVTRALLEEADHGDPTAGRIVRSHGLALGDYALAAARRVGIERTPFTLVLAGGVLRHQSTALADAIVERVRSASPDVRPLVSCFEPVAGALFLALEAIGCGVGQPIIRRVEETLPPANFFET